MSVLEDLAAAVEHGKKKLAPPLVEQALAEGIDPQVILNEGLIAPMDIIGEKFSRGEAFIPEMLLAARTMSACTEILKPHLSDGAATPAGKAVIGTTKGDMHDIGKNLVRMMLEAKGFEVADLGTDVSPERFVAWLTEHPDTRIVCISALLTTTMPAMAETVRAIREAGLCANGLKIFVGGAPVTQAYCDEIGADVYTSDAAECAAAAAACVA